MAFVASQLIEGVTAHAQSDSLEDAREICADGTYSPNNLRTFAVTEQWNRGRCVQFTPKTHMLPYLLTYLLTNLLTYPMVQSPS